MTLFRELARTDAMRFLRGLPRAKPHKHDVYVVTQGSTVRASMTAAPGALRTTAQSVFVSSRSSCLTRSR